jgi:hypothetical protein
MSDDTLPGHSEVSNASGSQTGDSAQTDDVVDSGQSEDIEKSPRRLRGSPLPGCGDGRERL